MYDINENNVLAKVHQYRLERPEGTLNINVAEIVEGKHFDSKFTAFPVFKLGATKKEYVGYGDTEIDALNKCLSLIKDKDRKTIMAPFGPDSRGATS